jgi:hypothetical protein
MFGGKGMATVPIQPSMPPATPVVVALRCAICNWVSTEERKVDRKRLEGGGAYPICEKCIKERYVFSEYSNAYIDKAAAKQGLDGKYYTRSDFERNWFTCSCCMQTTNKVLLITTRDHGYICPTCQEQQFFYCKTCNNMYQNNCKKVYGEEKFCTDCFNEVFTRCAVCNKVERRSNVYKLGRRGDNRICHDCAATSNLLTCQECNGLFEDKQIISLVVKGGTRNVCVECSRDYMECNKCKKHIKISTSGTMNMEFAEYAWYCKKCFNSLPPSLHSIPRPNSLRSITGRTNSPNLIDGDDVPIEQLTGVLNYSTKPRPTFLVDIEGKETTQYDTLFAAFELEVEAEEDKTSQQLTRDALELRGKNWLYCKHDGSIGRGFEVVSEPFTWKWFKSEVGKKQIGILLHWLRRNGYRSWDTHNCGLHVHLSEAAISMIELYKLQLLFYGNPDKIWLLSRRLKQHLQKWSRVYNVPTSGNKSKLIHVAKHDIVSVNDTADHANDRRVAVNVATHDTGNGHTVEIRIFKGSLKTDSINRAIEFCFSTVFFVKETGIKDVTWEKYMEYIEKRAKQFPALIKFFHSKPEPITLHLGVNGVQ